MTVNETLIANVVTGGATIVNSIWDTNRPATRTGSLSQITKTVVATDGPTTPQQCSEKNSVIVTMMLQ